MENSQFSLRICSFCVRTHRFFAEIGGEIKVLLALKSFVLNFSMRRIWVVVGETLMLRQKFAVNLDKNTLQLHMLHQSLSLSLQNARNLPFQQKTINKLYRTLQRNYTSAANHRLSYYGRLRFICLKHRARHASSVSLHLQETGSNRFH